VYYEDSDQRAIKDGEDLHPRMYER
jgi:hypothetical protein